MTEQHPARRSTTRASPRRSASSRPPVVTMIRTAFSATGLILGFSRAIQPDGGGEQRDSTQQQPTDDIGLPMHIEVQAVEHHQDDDSDRDRDGERTCGPRRGKAPQDEGQQPVSDYGADYVAAGEAVAQDAGQQVAYARAV